MSITKDFFGKTAAGTAVERFTITNQNNMRVSLITYGASIQRIFVPDKTGTLRDVTVGFDDLEGFENRSDYQGAIAGPYANRISEGAFVIDGATYPLVKNEDGVKTLHSGGEYTHTVWQGQESGDNAVTFSYTRPDGLNGYPGAIAAEITYTLTEGNELVLDYRCVSDKKTYINPTNHTYFNLGGFDSGDILSHKLTIHASRFTPVDKASIPSGELREVAGTPFDFRQQKPIGQDIEHPCEQLQNTGGYDHNFCIDGWNKQLREAAVAVCEETGISLVVSTDLPGIQFYAGNFLKGIIGKSGLPMNRRCGFCLETQYYPDTPHQPSFPSCLFDAGEEYRSQTVFAFHF